MHVLAWLVVSVTEPLLLYSKWELCLGDFLSSFQVEFLRVDSGFSCRKIETLRFSKGK